MSNIDRMKRARVPKGITKPDKDSVIPSVRPNGAVTSFGVAENIASAWPIAAILYAIENKCLILSFRWRPTRNRVLPFAFAVKKGTLLHRNFTLLNVRMIINRVLVFIVII